MDKGVLLHMASEQALQPPLLNGAFLSAKLATTLRTISSFQNDMRSWAVLPQLVVLSKSTPATMPTTDSQVTMPLIH